MGLRRIPLRTNRSRYLQGRDDNGQASVLLLFGLTIGLLALTLLFMRVGAANDMRSQAQTAADAAALAAVSALQDQAAEDLVNGNYPMPLFEEETAESRAEEYARQNGAVLTDIRASDNTLGRSGNIVRVEVRGAVCQKELAEDNSRAWGDVVCDGEEDDSSTTVGNASAIAIVHPPTECGRADDGGLDCAGGAVTGLDHARGLLDVNLVDQEGQYEFNPELQFAGGPMIDCASLGNLHPAMCAAHEMIQNEFGPFWLSAGGQRYEPGSDHHNGQAVDYMVAELGGTPTRAMDEMAVQVINWAIQNADQLQLKGIIYNYRIWNVDRDPVGTWPGVSRQARHHGNPTQDHVDHIHLAAGPGPMQ